MSRVLNPIWLLILFSAWVRAGEGLVVMPSSHDFDGTFERLEQAVQSAGLVVFAKFDHSAAATAAGMTLSPSKVLVFGNPKLGTKLMSANPAIALDLPLRVAVWQDSSGQVALAYTSPDYLLARFGMDAKQEIVKKMSGLLDGLAKAATSP